MPIEIRETIVTPCGGDQDAIQLHIADAAPDDESLTFQLRLLVKMRASRTPTLAHIQRMAMKLAQDALTPILQDLAREIQESGYGLELSPKNPRR
jgi:hypothetical protein